MAYYPITPVPKPRMTQADKWKQRPSVLRYRAFADEVQLRGVKLPAAGASVVFLLPMPKSWSNKKKAAMVWQPHTQKPDYSNLIKSLEDAIFSGRGNDGGDDSHIWHYATQAKLWAPTGGIVVVSDKTSGQNAKDQVEQILRVDNLLG